MHSLHCKGILPIYHKSLIIRAAEIAQLVSLERRSLFRPWSSEPCQGRGREFESRFPLQSEGQFPADLFSCPDLPDGTLYDAAQGLREVEH